MARKPKAALIIPRAATTGRYLMGLRSWKVSRPYEWAPFGGHIEKGETPANAAVRELREETMYSGPLELVRMTNVHVPMFIATVPEEFPPILNWEHLNAKWMNQSEAFSLLMEYLG